MTAREHEVQFGIVSPTTAEMLVMDSRLDIAPDNGQSDPRCKGQPRPATQDTKRRVARLEPPSTIKHVCPGHSVAPDWSIPAFAAVKAAYFGSFVRD